MWSPIFGNVLSSVAKKGIDITGKLGKIISNEEVEDIMKIFKLLEESGLLIKRISETVKNEAKEQKSGFLGMLLGALAASLLGSAITGQGVTRAGKKVIRD